MSQPVFFLVPLIQTNAGSDVVFPLTVGEHVVGRESTADIQLRSDLVSRRQARLVVTDQSVTIIDLQSTNGTWVAGERVTEKQVRPGQEIRFGEYPMMLSTTTYVEVDSEIETRRVRRRIVPPAVPLSPAQNRVFLRVIDQRGLTEKEIGVKLGLSVNTVHRHMRDIFGAYGVRSRPELILKALGINDV